MMRCIYRGNQGKIDDYQNDGAASYLSVAGVVYGLVLAQILAMANERLKGIQQALAEECAGVHRCFLLIAALSAKTTAQRTMKRKILDILQVYCEAILQEIELDVVDLAQLSTVYSLVPALQLAAKEEVGDFHTEVAGRCIDAAGDLSTARYRRSSLEAAPLNRLFYALNVLLCNSMFFGILLIYSGSFGLNFTFCLICVGLIASTSYVIADMDSPHEGLFVIELEDVARLADDISKRKDSRSFTRGFSAELGRVQSLASKLTDSSARQLEAPPQRGVLPRALSCKKSSMRTKVAFVTTLNASINGRCAVITPTDADGCETPTSSKSLRVQPPRNSGRIPADGCETPTSSKSRRARLPRTPTSP